jgi:predicted MPP superfamily phosphohydrolase
MVRMSSRSVLGRALLAGTVAGAASLAYAAGHEVRSYRLRRVTVPVLPDGAPHLRVLQVSDLHLTPSQKGKREWVRSLAGLEPDLVVDTGDNLAHPDAVPEVLDALGPLLDRPGAFVLGSNDYYSPVLKNPFRYLLGDTGSSTHGRPIDLPWGDLVSGFRAAGWTDLTNARGTVEVAGVRLALRGVDDPHVRRDDYQAVAGGADDDDADLSLGVVHAPYHRVTDAMAEDGVPLVLAGHTHGGQVRLPFYGALVSNCDLAPSRARGLSRHSGSTWLHVSAGLGTSPYAPIRFACPPEATLLTLVARPCAA